MSNKKRGPDDLNVQLAVMGVAVTCNGSETRNHEPCIIKKKEEENWG